LCTYNGAQFLREQLDSLFAQTHQNFEIVAVDDCSTDESLKILDEYARLDSRLQVHANATNLGPRNNFEVAMKKCRGAFIAPCDQDDIWMPEKLAMLLNVIGTHTMAYSDSEMISVCGQPLGTLVSNYVAMMDINDPAVFVFDNCVSGHAMLFRREVLDVALPIPAEFLHDWWLAARAASLDGIICHAHPLVKYRQHAANVTDMRREHVVDRKLRARGFRLASLRLTGSRIALLSKLSGPNRWLLIQLHKLWVQRESQWLSWPLAWLVFKHRALLYAARKSNSSLFLLRRASYFIWGLRFKRLINPYAYDASGNPVEHAA
jgi:glycosyltransferase involved in cell wall biosynthesis